MAEFTLPQGYLEPEKDHNIAALRAELAQVRVENARLEQWNNAVAVCEKHTGRIIASGCYVCVADEFEGENTALRARIAKLEAEVERVKKEWFRVAEQYNRETSRLNAVRVRLREALQELEAENERHKSNHAEILRQFREATTELARRAAEIERLRALLAEVVGWADHHGEEPWGLEQARAALEGK